MTLSPNTPITQDNVGLLKAGSSVLMHAGDLVVFSHFAHDDPEYFYLTTLDEAHDYPGGTADEFTYIGERDAEGWIGWSGGENPAGDLMVEIKCKNGYAATVMASAASWSWPGYSPDPSLGGDITAFRPALSPPAENRFAAEDACLACNDSTPAPVDWTVVGPKLVEALRPFAECADLLDGSDDVPRAPDGEWAKFRLLTDDYRRARAVIAEAQKEALA